MGQCREWTDEQFLVHVKSLADAMIGYKDVDGVLVTMNGYDERIKICLKCSEREGNTCTAGLGCALALYARVQAKDCPKGKW